MIIGDSLGSQVEFRSARDIAREYPDGVRLLRPSPVWRTLAGQPTDDSELALALARSLVGRAAFDAEETAAAYARWYKSGPFDCGNTTRVAFVAASRASDGKAAAARLAADRNSESNGSLMRIAPIGIWARTPEEAADAARGELGAVAPARWLPDRLCRVCRRDHRRAARRGSGRDGRDGSPVR